MIDITTVETSVPTKSEPNNIGIYIQLNVHIVQLRAPIIKRTTTTTITTTTIIMIIIKQSSNMNHKWYIKAI
jgi:hypothetical protein